MDKKNPTVFIDEKSKQLISNKREKINIVLDNLNTHFEKPFYEAFAEEEAKRLLGRINFHYTPKHASWLNMAEIEISMLEDECIGKRDAYKKNDKTKPSSHMTTGMVLRAFSTHPNYRKKTVSLNAAKLLKERFFKPDKYNNRKHPDYWVKFEYPYWWTTLLSSLDSLYDFGFRINDKYIQKAIEWLLINQKEDGLWGNIPAKGNIDKYKLERAWMSYDICRLLKLYLV